MLLPIFQYMQSTDWGTALRESALVYPIIMATHLGGMALFGGMILLVDMRLLGLALTKHSVSDVVDGLRVWKRIGFVLVAGCGFMLAWSESMKYYPNPFFWTKLTLLGLVLVHWLVFRRSVYGNTAVLDQAAKMPGVAKVAAVSSMVLWSGLVTFGRLIGYWEG